MSETALREERYQSRRLPAHLDLLGIGQGLLYPALRFWVAVLICGLVAASVLFFYSQGLTNVYGDAIAHMQSARRLWDSRTPGYEEIGRAWLPLFHILVSPLTRTNFLWRSALAGSLVSAVAFGVAAWFIFCLGRVMNGNASAGIAALGGFALCPTALYLASVPLTESLALMWLVLVVYGLFRYQQNSNVRVLIGAALACFFGALTRYDGWNILPFACLFVWFVTPAPRRIRIRRTLLFSMIAGAGPLLWILYNAQRYGNPLDFYNGPFSARAIYAHQLATTGFHYPTDGSLLLSGRYYLEDLRLIIGAWPLILSVLGFVAWVVETPSRARRSASLLLLTSLPFYLQAMAHAAVPLYVPTLFPHGFYNLRYGIEMLPAIAILPSFLFSPRLPRPVRSVLLLGIVATVLGNAISMMRGGARQLPIVKESLLNTPCRSTTQHQISNFLRARYDGQGILMATGRWACAMSELGIPFRNTIAENNRSYWREIQTHPERWVRWIIRGDGDSVDGVMRAHPGPFSNYQAVERSAVAGDDSFTMYHLGPMEDKSSRMLGR